MRGGVKIATFNVNNVNKRLPVLLAWLKAARPDIVCLQELKAADAEFPEAALRKAGYAAVWVGQKGWNGVAILARRREIVVTRRRLPGGPHDKQSRYIEAAVAGIIVGCLYAPNGDPQPGPKFDDKLAWLKRLNRHAAMLLKCGRRWCWRAISTWCRRRPISARPPHGIRTRWCSPRRASCSRRCCARAGPMHCGTAIRTTRPIRSARTGETGSSATRACGSITCCSIRRWRWLKRAGVDRKVRAAPQASDHAPAWIVID